MHKTSNLNVKTRPISKLEAMAQAIAYRAMLSLQALPYGSFCTITPIDFKILKKEIHMYLLLVILFVYEW